jgi:hypothetical protein
MKLNEQTIKLSKGRNETCAKIRLSEKVSIPAASELFVEGYVDGKLKVDFGGHQSWPRSILVQGKTSLISS